MFVHKTNSHLGANLKNGTLTVHFGFGQKRSSRYSYKNLPVVILKRFAQDPGGRTFHKLVRKLAVKAGTETSTLTPTYTRIH
jgi:hypothetical protein